MSSGIDRPIKNNLEKFFAWKVRLDDDGLPLLSDEQSKNFLDCLVKAAEIQMEIELDAQGNGSPHSAEAFRNTESLLRSVEEFKGRREATGVTTPGEELSPGEQADCEEINLNKDQGSDED